MPDEHSPSAPKLRRRYGIGEWFGRSFVEMSAVERAEVAQAISRGEADRLCPWRSRSGQPRVCTKKGGVCSLRLYEQNTDTGEVWAPGGDKAGFCTTCPERFYEDDMVFAWIGEVMLASHSPIVLSEIGFLDRENTASEQGSTRSEVGKIDHVLVHPERDTLTWCALEMQAVYFSGASMSKEFSALRTAGDYPGLPFPAAHRRPDFRSSGPKRLMPQLQIKVPALRRWGKKAAVVVDRAFFDALGEMDDVPSLSNADIAWFIVAYREQEQGVALEPDFVRLTTLERAVEGLTAGRPVSLQTFEQRIREKLGS